MARKHKHRDDDLFKDSTMTFGEHLEELRSCLFKAIFGLAIAFILVLVLGWADGVVNVIQSPLKEALGRYYIGYAKKRLEPQIQALSSQGVQTPSYHRLVDAVIKQQVIPSLQLMDVRETLGVIQQRHTLKALDEVLGQFAPADFLDVQQFCQDLAEDGKKQDHPASFIWERLSEDAKQLFTQCAKDGPARDPEERLKQERQLAGELSKLLSDEQFSLANRAYFDAIQEYAPSWWQRYVDVTGDVAERQAKAERVKELRRDLNAPEHYRELNRQLLALVYPESIAAGPRKRGMVAVPFFQRLEDDSRINLKSLNAQEMFMIWIKAALLLSLVIASPWVFYQIWTFVAAGLFPHEKRYAYTYLPFSLGLFLAGVALCFVYVLPLVLDFLFLFNETMNVDPDVRISEWFGFALFLPLGFGIAFQLPLVMLFMERIGVMSVSTYVSKWRISVLVISVASAVLTPADPYSMLLMAIPLVFLYFGGIFLCKYMPKGRSLFPEEEEEET